jgi:hypothetical protein
VVFTQPVSPSGVPAQFVEHILGEVYVDSLAVPAGPAPNLDFSSSTCGGAGSHSGKATSGGGASASGGGGSAAGGSGVGGSGSAGSGSLSGSGSALGSSAQQGSGSGGGTSLPAAFAAALRKPLWLLLAYLVWQSLVIGTGASLWNWRRDGAP